MLRSRRRTDTAPDRAPLRIASFPPPIPQNPYQRLLYAGLAREGIELAPSGALRVGWLIARRREIDTLHFHWPETYYRHRGATTPATLALSWIRLVLFGVRLATARVLGYRILWTVHQVEPHESPSPRLDRAGTRLLARLSDLLVAHDRSTAERAAARLRLSRPPAVVPHGSYLGVYPRGRPRAEVRAELGVDADAIVFLSLGHLRRYKGLDLLLAAFGSTRASLPAAALVVAGMPLDSRSAADLAEAAAEDARIKPLPGFVPDERVAELFEAADAAVLARVDGGTSGSLVLALSQGVPVLAASLPAYADLLAASGAGWLFDPADPAALAAAFEAAAAEPGSARSRRAAAALAQAEALDWGDASRTLAELIRSAGR